MERVGQSSKFILVQTSARQERKIVAREVHFLLLLLLLLLPSKESAKLSNLAGRERFAVRLNDFLILARYEIS